MLKFKRIILSQLVVMSILVLIPFAALAAGSVSLVQAGPPGSFDVVANGVNGAVAYHLFIGYDPARLSGPRVVQGPVATGSLFVTNPNVPGTIQVAAVSMNSMASRGVLATINFNPIGENPGSLTLSGTILDVNQKNMNVAKFGWPLATTGSADQSTQENPKTPEGPTSTTLQGGTPSGGSTGVVGGNVTMPTDSSSKESRDASGQPPQQESRGEKAAAVPETPETATSQETPAAVARVEKFVPRKLTAVLDRFRLFAGDKTPANLLSLFQREPEDIFAQQPTVVLTDGVATVMVTIPRLPGNMAPNFSFSKARFVGLRQAGDGEWLLEALPEKGALRASVNLIVGDVVQEIPLTVAPKVNVDLDKSRTVTEADFQLFLKTRGTAAAPKYDLNGDGKRDYQDEYIFAANYQVQQARKEIPAAKKP